MIQSWEELQTFLINKDTEVFFIISISGATVVYCMPYTHKIKLVLKSLTHGPLLCMTKPNSWLQILHHLMLFS